MSSYFAQVKAAFLTTFHKALCDIATHHIWNLLFHTPVPHSRLLVVPYTCQEHSCMWPLHLMFPLSRLFFPLIFVWNFCLSSFMWKLLSRVFNPMDHRVHGILQARILAWIAFPFSRGSSQPRDRTQVSHTAGRFFSCPCSNVYFSLMCQFIDPGLIAGSGTPPGKGNSNPLQSSGLENLIGKGAWWATVHEITKSWTRLSL